jgi:tRNA(fMet)-specific endonuclease VapC
VVRYALDTNILSYYMRRQGGVVARVQAQPPGRIVLPSVVVHEVDYGLRRAGRRDSLDAFNKMVQASVVLAFDAESADHAARIRLELEAAGTPIGGPDLLIAATARRHGCTLVTHNTREFSRVPQLTLDDWY